MWPIRDVTGQTLGFGARRLFDDDQGPKYLNTPETPVYRKSHVLYGLDLAKRDIARGRQAVIVEGYTDVMACHLAGITTAVATCGTAFGVDHITLIRRVLGDHENRDTTGTGEVVFTFDPDEAGQKAASRAFAEEQRFAAQTFVAVAPDGLDPCDLRLARGDDAVRRLIDSRTPMFEFMVRRELRQHDLETVEGRVAALRAAAPIVAGIRDQSLSNGYERRLAGWLGVDPGEVSRAVSASRRSGSGDRRPDHRAPVRAESPGSHREPPLGERRGEQDDAPSEPALSLTQLPADPMTRLERDAVMAVLQYPDAVGRDLVARVASSAFHNATLAVVRDGIAATLDRFGGSSWTALVADEVPPGFSTLVQQLAVAPLPGRADQLGAYCRGVAAGLVDRDLLRRKAELLGALQRTDATGDPERYSRLQHDLVTIERERRTLREA